MNDGEMMTRSNLLALAGSNASYKWNQPSGWLVNIWSNEWR